MWTGKCLGRKRSWPIRSTVPAVSLITGLKPQRTQFRISGVPAEIRTKHLPNIQSRMLSLDQPVQYRPMYICIRWLFYMYNRLMYGVYCHVGWYAWRKLRVLVRMIGFVSTSVTISLNCQLIQRYRWFTHFPVHRCSRTGILSFY
jgi:hypothetical protein